MEQTSLKSFSFDTEEYTRIKDMNEDQFLTYCQDKLKKYEEDKKTDIVIGVKDDDAWDDDSSSDADDDE